MIEVGEYVRTIYGEIFKVFQTPKIPKNRKQYILVDGEVDRNIDRDCNDSYLEVKEIKKHSKNIIDLIEIGDYVNGEEITYINQDPFIKGQINLWIDRYEIYSFGDSSRIKYLNEDIKTVLTKEQFSNMEYRLEE